MRQLLHYMEESTRENAVNEELREIHRMVETVKKDPEVAGMRIQLVDDVLRLSEEKARLSEEKVKISEENAKISEEKMRLEERNMRLEEENAKLREALKRSDEA